MPRDSWPSPYPCEPPALSVFFTRAPLFLLSMHHPTCVGRGKDGRSGICSHTFL